MWYRRVNDPRCWYAVMVGLVAAALLWGTSSAQAQAPTWQERRTKSFAILYPDLAGTSAVADEYATFVDGIYDEVSAVFGYNTPPPVILRIYPTMELYIQANPMAAQMPGVVAHAHTGRREISIALPQTANQPQDQIRNNVRHELTHIIAADLSGDKLTTAFQEGIAQYLEHPSAELDAKMQLMQQVVAADRVLPWRELNQPGAAYADPRIGYPESYTIVAFLIQRADFATFKRFVEESKTSSGYRGALEAAYGVSADQLEREWLAQLPDFINGGYRERTSGAFDLSQAEALLQRGEYAEAITQLEAAVATLAGTEQADVAERARALLEQAQAGQRASSLAGTARDSLTRGDYQGAKLAAAEGRQILNELGQAEQMAVMAQYEALADEGLAAQERLLDAQGKLQGLQVSSAREQLAEAYRTFTRLGDNEKAGVAQQSLVRIQRTETGVAVVLVLLAALIAGWNIHRRVNERDQAVPFG